VVGLSANQIGISKRVSVVVGKNGRVWKLINPIIETRSDEMIKYLEGCMSLPGKTSVTIRHQKVSD
jgi:peptide deformylase